jgi:hypothetical protein
MVTLQELEKQLAEAKAEEKRKELQTLTENLISKYQGKLTESQFRKKTDQRTSAWFYEKSLGYRQYDNSIEMEHILCRRKKHKFSSDKLSLTETN